MVSDGSSNYNVTDSLKQQTDSIRFWQLFQILLGVSSL